MRTHAWPAAVPSQRIHLLLALLVQGLQWTSARDTHVAASSAYDWGYYGAYPVIDYESFGAKSPKPNLVRTDDRCDAGFIFVEPRGLYVKTPGPVMLDNDGNLVWMDTKWGQAMDVKVQQYKGKDYITFWHGSDSGTFGQGYYLMLDENYQVFKNVTAAGDRRGDLHEFRITERGTALMTIYEAIPADMSSYGISDGWIFDSVFQEIDLHSGVLLFEWRASDHYKVEESLAPLGGAGKDARHAFDFFHINSIDKGADGDYIVSSRYMWAVTAISHVDGDILWQLGGKNNSFKDLSEGEATDFSWNHHAAWHENTTLTIFDNGSNGREKTAKFSRGLMITLDTDAMTATLLQDYVAPQKFLSPSQGSVQVLPNGNVLVGWGHVPAFTEYTMDGQVLCDTHIGVVNFDLFAWAKNYRTFKYPWVGRPNTLPSVAMRPKKKALFVSWNGATQVVSWQLQSGPKAEGDGFRDHRLFGKKGFETRLPIPPDADEYVRVVALDQWGKALAASAAVSKHETTVIEQLYSPERTNLMEPFHIFCLALFGTAVGLLSLSRFRASIRRCINGTLRRRDSFKYQVLPKSA